MTRYTIHAPHAVNVRIRPTTASAILRTIDPGERWSGYEVTGESRRAADGIMEATWIGDEVRGYVWRGQLQEDRG